MKKLIFVLSLGLIIGMVNINKAEAQVRVRINIDIQPSWGPSGYNYAEFYYIPEINVYFDVINHLYYYRNGRRWVSGLYLPMAYSHYDFYSLYKVVINGVRSPWRSNRNHIRLYSGYSYNYSQMPIFYVTEPRYHRARVNYHGWVEPRYMPGNNGRPHSNNFSANTRNGRINDSRSTPPRRETVSTRSTQRETTINNRNSSRNDRVNNNSTVGNRSSSRSDSRNNSSVAGRSSGNDNRSNLSTGNNANRNDRSSSSVNSRSSSRNSNESSARSSTRSSSSDSKSSRSTDGRTSDRTERSGRR